MYSTYKFTDLPQSEEGLLEFLWLQYLHAARGGSDEDATMMLVGLSWHVQQNSLTPTMREFLSDALLAVAEAAPGKDRGRAAKDHLLLGRRAGGRPPYMAEILELRRVLRMWTIIGDVDDKDLDAACEIFLSLDSAEAPDMRSLKRAYLKHRPNLRRAWPTQGPNFE